MKRSLLRIGAPVLVLTLGAGGVLLLKATAPQPEQESETARPVTVYTHTARALDTTLTVHTQGEVRARTMINLTAQVGGRVLDVAPAYVEGGRFDTETVLLEIDDSDYRLALRQAEAAVAAADLAVQQALADADVARKQLTDLPSATPLSLKQPQIAEARARREAALAELELARLNLERTRVKLPFEGRVATTTVHIGEVINESTALGQVFATDRVEVRLPLNDQQLDALGLPIGFSAGPAAAPGATFHATVAGRRHTWHGELRHVDAALDPRTRLIYATAEVVDPYGEGRSEGGMPMAVGLFVDAELEGRELTQVVEIPSKGLRPGEQIYVVDASGQLDIRTVSVASNNARTAIIREGLRPGERVVVSTLRNPVSGMRVETIDEERLAASGN